MRGVAAVVCVVIVAFAATGSVAAEADKERPAVEINPITVLDTIVVESSIIERRDVPGSVSRITARQLDRQNQAFDDIHRILFRLPGINVQEEDGYGLRPNIGLRGTGLDRSANITLMEDAVLIAPAPYASPSAYYFPIAGRMSGIEVRKGSSQIKYGPRTNGGAVNLISTPIPRELKGNARIAGGGNATAKLHANYGDRRGQFSWLLETYQIRTDGFKQLDTGGNTGFELSDYVGKLEYTTDPTTDLYHKFTFKIGYTDETSNETYLGLTDTDYEATPFRRYAASQNDVMNSDHNQYQLRHHMIVGERASLTTTLYRNEFDRNWYKLDRVSGTSISDVLADPQSYAAEMSYITGSATSPDDALAVKANNRSYYSQGVESASRLYFSAAGRHELEAGVRVHGDQEDRYQHSDGYRMEAGGTIVRTSIGVPGAAGGGDNRVNSALAIAAYAQDRIEMGLWSLTPGVRFEHIEMRREQYGAGDPDRLAAPVTTETTTDVVVPGIGVAYTTPSWSTFGGIHRGFAPPGPGADDETRPEESINYEVGGRYALSRVGAEVVAFFNDYSNLLGRDTFSSGGTGSGDLYNAGEVDAYGLETSLSFQGSAREASVPVSISYTYTVAEFQNTFDSDFGPWGSVVAGDRLPYVPRHQVSTSAGVYTSGWGFALAGSYISKTPTEALQGPIPDDKSADERFLLDVTGEVAIGGYARAFASLQNATDVTYVAARRPAGVRPGMPREFMLGLKLGF